MERTCTICKKEYESMWPTLYCSEGCRKEGRKRYHAAWQKDNKQKQQKYMKQYYKDHSEEMIAYDKKYKAEHREEYLIKGRARWHRYYADPVNKEKRRKHDQLPEIKEKRKRYAHLPEIKERRRRYAHERYWKGKEVKE